MENGKRYFTTIYAIGKEYGGWSCKICLFYLGQFISELGFIGLHCVSGIIYLKTEKLFCWFTSYAEIILFLTCIVACQIKIIINKTYTLFSKGSLAELNNLDFLLCYICFKCISYMYIFLGNWFSFVRLWSSFVNLFLNHLPFAVSH